MGEDMTEAEFDLLLRERSAEPEVRRLMPVMHRLFDGDGYTEDEDGFRWLVIDATRIVDFVADGHTIPEALEDSGRWDPSDPLPPGLVASIESALSASSTAREDDDQLDELEAQAVIDAREHRTVPLELMREEILGDTRDRAALEADLHATSAPIVEVADDE